ncbi:MAG TPA: hypothetical protein VJ770_10830 [Stellaceae bacterium]|nr:hypothetical protein [Stellaceae bacterium]
MLDLSWASWANPAATWAPVCFVVLTAALGLTVAGSPPMRRGARRLWVAALFLCGALAVAGTVWQAQERLGAGAAAQTAAALAARVRSLQDQVAQLHRHREARAIAPGTAAKLAAYLKKSGSRQIVVSTIADDTEAYDYANQLVTILRAADWQTGGPEITKAFGDIEAVGVTLFANPQQPSDTAKILTDAFNKFNIPYQPRVTPSGVVPDSDAAELFVGALPGTKIASAASPQPEPVSGHVSAKAAEVGQGSGEAAPKAGRPH